jgi:hypothetical protein
MATIGKKRTDLKKKFMKTYNHDFGLKTHHLQGVIGNRESLYK